MLQKQSEILWSTRKWTREKNTVKNYQLFLDRFNSRFGDQNIQSVAPDEILTFLVQNTENQKQTTKRFKYILLKTLFNFIKNAFDSSFVNPCDSSILKKTFRVSKGRQWSILEKNIVDECIFRSDNPRNRLMLELMARGGMRPPMPADPAHPLKLSATSFSGMPIFQPPSDIWGKLAIPKPWDGLKTYFINEKYRGWLHPAPASLFLNNIECLYLICH